MIQHTDRGLNNGRQQETRTTRKYLALELLEQLEQTFKQVMKDLTHLDYEARGHRYGGKGCRT